MEIKKNLHIIGPYPPPFGGVSVHISRMIPFLRSAGIDFIISDQYNTLDVNNSVFPTRGKFLWWIKNLFFSRAVVTHFHQFSFLIFIYSLLFRLIRRSKVIVTIHNENLLGYGVFLRSLGLLLVKLNNKALFIIVSERLFNFMKENGIYNVAYIPAYVPPVVESPKILERKKDGPIVVFNAWTLDLKRVNVYGFDLLVDLALEFEDFNFYCFIGDLNSRCFFTDFCKKKGANNVYGIYGCNLTDYLSSADVFLRLNREDAYGVSVKESLDLGTTVIASDICARADGTILFQTGSLNSLRQVFQNVVDSSFTFDSSGIEKTEFHLKLIKIYQNLLETYETSNPNS